MAKKTTPSTSQPQFAVRNTKDSKKGGNYPAMSSNGTNK